MKRLSGAAVRGTRTAVAGRGDRKAVGGDGEATRNDHALFSVPDRPSFRPQSHPIEEPYPIADESPLIPVVPP